MNLLGTKLYDPGTAVSKATSSLLAMTAFDTTNLRVTATVPSHGNLRFRMRCAATGATTQGSVLLGVLNGATVVGRIAPTWFPGTLSGATAVGFYEAEFTVSGLTPGSTNFDAAYAVQVVVASTNIKYGGPNNNSGNNAWGGFLFEVWDPQPMQTNGQLVVDANGRVDVIKIAGTTQTARDIGASVLVGDKTGFSLSAAGVQAIWDALTSALTTVGSVGKLLVDNVNATISSRSTLTAANVWDALTSGITTAGSVGKRIVDFLTGDAYARLGAPVGASTSADIAAVKALLPTALVGGKMDSNVGSYTSAIDPALRRGTAQAGASASITLDASASSVGGFYNGAIVALVSGTGAGQCRRIEGYNPSTKVATISPPWATNPSNTTGFVLYPAQHRVNVGSWKEVTVKDLTNFTGSLVSDAIRSSTSGSGHGASSFVLAAGVSTSAIDDFYNGYILVIDDSSLANGGGQVRRVVGYNGATLTCTIDRAWDVIPIDGVSFLMYPDAPVNVTQIEGADATNQIRDSVLSDATRFAGANIDTAISTRSTLTAADVWAYGTRTLTSFGTLVADVWAYGTRVLTAGTNIVLAKGTGVTGFNDLSAAQVNAEADTALADYDGPTHAEMTSELAALPVPLTAGGTRAAVGLAAANLDTQLDAIPTAAEINAEVDTALADYDAPTHAELTSELATADDAVLAAIASLNDVSASEVESAVWDHALGGGYTAEDAQQSGLMLFDEPTNLTLEVKKGDGTTLFTRTLTREQLDAITSAA